MLLFAVVILEAAFTHDGCRTIEMTGMLTAARGETMENA